MLGVTNLVLCLSGLSRHAPAQASACHGESPIMRFAANSVLPYKCLGSGACEPQIPQPGICLLMQGSLLALDISASRLGLLQTSARQQHLDSLISTHAISLQSFVADPESGSRVPARGFDKVLLDAPCSGTGVLGKRADLRWRRTGKDLQELIALQVSMPCGCTDQSG